MPPRLQLPPKKAKSKRPPPINFASVATALASASLDADEWSEEGERQEGQGERYQSGDKAQRHYMNAATAYRVASSLVPAFDSTYNAARVLFLLATEHLPAPECLTVLQESIQEYRTALSLEQQRGEQASVTNVLDGSFNLAQALVALVEMVDEGAVASGSAGNAAWEAKELFADVERHQMDEMAKTGSGGEATSESDESASEMSSAGSVQLAEAVETRVVTPSQVINTLLEAISLDLFLYATIASSSFSSDTLLALATSASATLERARQLRQLIPVTLPNAEQDLQLSLAAIRLASTVPGLSDPSAVAEQYATLLRAPENSANPELLSDYADYLVEIVDSLDAPEDPLPLLEEASTSYTRVHTLLSNRLSPPSSIPSHTIPALVSSNLVSQAYISLFLYHYHLSTSAAKAKLAIASADANASAASVAAAAPPSTSWARRKARRDAALLRLRLALRTKAPLGSELRAQLSPTDFARYVEECRDDAVWRLTGPGVEEGWWAQV